MACNYSLEKSAWENEAWCFIHFSTHSLYENSYQNLVVIILLLGKVLSSHEATQIRSPLTLTKREKQFTKVSWSNSQRQKKKKNKKKNPTDKHHLTKNYYILINSNFFTKLKNEDKFVTGSLQGVFNLD